MNTVKKFVNRVLSMTQVCNYEKDFNDLIIT